MIEVRVVGVDLSWTSTGLVDNLGRVELVTTTHKDHASERHRLDHITKRVLEFLDPRPALVLVESPSFGSNTRAIQMGGLWWYVTQAIWHQRHEMYDVSPRTRMQWATGKGQADKTTVAIAVARREPDLPIATDDIADAAALRSLGAYLLDVPVPGWESPSQPQLKAAMTLLEAIEKHPATGYFNGRWKSPTFGE